MMTPQDWRKIVHFKPTDNWGNPLAMDLNLVQTLDKFRMHLQHPIYVTSGNNGSHSPNSFHYIENGSCAVDVVIPSLKDEPMLVIFEALKFGFNGIGYYPHWTFNGVTVGGYHFDTRPFDGKKDTWIKTSSETLALSAWSPELVRSRKS